MTVSRQTPRKRPGGRGSTPAKREDIFWGVGRCALGSLLVASTKKGICAIFLADHSAKLIRELRRQFPRANLIRAPKQTGRLLRQVARCVEHPEKSSSLRLDIRGTPFERRIWRVLRAIPPGRTITYAKIAKKIGRPQSFRAVGSACAANCLALAIPCHRVIGSDGSLTGYRWGLQRKQALLARESQDRSLPRNDKP